MDLSNLVEHLERWSPSIVHTCMPLLAICAALAAIGNEHVQRGTKTVINALFALHQLFESCLSRNPAIAYPGPDWLMRPLAAADMTAWYAAALVPVLLLLDASMRVASGPSGWSYFAGLIMFLVNGYLLQLALRFGRRAQNRVWRARDVVSQSELAP